MRIAAVTYKCNHLPFYVPRLVFKLAVYVTNLYEVGPMHASVPYKPKHFID